MSRILFLAVFLFSNLTYGAAGDSVTTNKDVISELKVQLYQGKAYYYFSPSRGHWEMAGCENTKYAYVIESDYTKSILSVGLTARTTKTPVKFIGVCGSDTGDMTYMQITNIVM